jgi:hypothetical protein
MGTVTAADRRFADSANIEPTPARRDGLSIGRSLAPLGIYQIISLAAVPAWRDPKESHKDFAAARKIVRVKVPIGAWSVA